MTNYKLEYWIEAVESALEAIETDLSVEDITSIAEDMLISAEQEGMAFGHDAIANPLQTEIDQMKARFKQEEERWERRDWIYRESIATRARVKPEDVYIQYDTVYIS